MPFTKIGDVPKQIRTHQGIPLTLPQANKWAEIFDRVKNVPDIDSPAAVTWATWTKVFKKEGNRWVRVKKQRVNPDKITSELSTDKLKEKREYLLKAGISENIVEEILKEEK